MQNVSALAYRVPSLHACAAMSIARQFSGVMIVPRKAARVRRSSAAYFVNCVIYAGDFVSKSQRMDESESEHTDYRRSLCASGSLTCSKVPPNMMCLNTTLPLDTSLADKSN